MHIAVLLVAFFLRGILVNTQMITKNNKSCSGITLGTEFGISATRILKKPVKGMNLKICQSNLTCCSQQMEKGLYIRSSRLLKDAIHLAMNDTLNFLATQESTFDDYFKRLFIQAQAKWHSMLLQTYKQSYKENRYMFQAFFSTLEDYYRNGNVTLTNATEAFFDVLLRKVLVLLKPTLSGSHGFLNCVSNKIGHIYYPFVKSRMDLTSQLKSSFTAARRFVEGLKVARNVAASLINRQQTRNCFESFTKIRHCSICRGIPDAMVCKGSCGNVLQSCFPAATAVDAVWNDFFDQLYLLSIAMEGPYNIEVFAGRLSYDISSVIMNLQSNVGVILKKGNQLCVGKTKRSADSTSSDLYLEGDRRSKRASSTLPKHFGWHTSRPSRKSIISLDSLIQNFRKQINGKKNEWSNLLKKICSDQSFVSSDGNSSCWNGIGLQSNSSNVPQLKSINNKANSLGEVQAQLLLLKIETEKVKLALPERDEDFVHQGDDDDDDDDNISGNGSGSGSGSGTTHTTVTPTDFSPSVQTTSFNGDDEDEEGSGSGSGSGTPPPNEITEVSTEATKSNNSVDLISTGFENLEDHPNDVNNVFVTTDPVIFGSRNSAGSLIAHLWLFLSALLLYIF